MLSLFFGASDLSLRTIGQAIHRLGLLYGSLPKNLVDYGLATTVALILRTMDPKLYGRFVAGEVSDGEVIDAIFSRPGLRTQRYEELSATIVAVVILAGLEDALPNWSPTAPLPSPLLDRYKNWDRTDRELFEEEVSEDAARKAEADHAQRVARRVEEAIYPGRANFGFSHAVRRLELLSDSLIENPPDASSESA